MPPSSFRRDRITRPIFRWAAEALPRLSATEREAINAGDVWWDAELFTGRPQWDRLLACAPARLSQEEQDFLAGPVEELSGMLDDWKINWLWHDLPPQAWEFLKANKFFAMIIPKAYGGLGFSAYAHSEVIRKLSSRSICAACTAMVPNSLGPGELLVQFGTKAQRDYWLPRLARGEEIPCFGLTSPEAGSDAASMTDAGVVCHDRYEGSDVLGIRLNWHKRYITLGPVATVLGLAFKLFDPDHLIGDRDEVGITLALVPTHLPGISIGRRHLPAMHVFQNGPNWGRDVFIPMDNVIGGLEQAGKGWKMLMSALAAGRGISLPSLSAAGAAYTAHVTGAYARIREQFHVSIGQFEAIKERLGRMAATAYLLDAARRMTCAALDDGHHPAVITAIMKAQATERMRIVVNDAMDVHGGKAIIEGPRNYLGSLYRGVPIGITVEGANIVTRSLIQFGQGAIRCHPYLLKEMMALEDPDRARGLDAFDAALWGHVRHGLTNAARAFLHALTAALFAPAPQATAASKYYRQLSRYSAAFALAVDLALLTLGGGLKRKEMLSARFGDILSELYLASAALKRWNDEGRQQDDLPLLAWCMQSSFATIEARFDEIFANMPNRPVAWLLRAFILPFGRRRRGPSDRLTEACAAILTNPSAARERLVAALCHPAAHERDTGLGLLERAFALTVAVQPIRDRMRKARVRDIGQAERQRTIDATEVAQLREAAEAVAAAIAVDDFAPEELTSRGAFQQGDVSSPAILQPTSPATPDELRLPPAAAE
jgi:acyl-CoA dehydrogenase